MQAILAVTFPFFALVLCGYARRAAARAAGVGDPGAQRLRAVFRAALHAVPLRHEHADRRSCSNPAVLAVYLLCALAIVVFTIAVTLVERACRLNDAAFGALVAAFPNTGFMGVPLLVALLGAGRRRPGRSAACWSTCSSPPRCASRWRRRTRPRRAGARAAALKARARHAGQPAALGDRAGRGGIGRWVAGSAVRPMPDRAHAGRCGQPGGAVHHRRRAVASPASMRTRARRRRCTCRWPRSSCSRTRCWCSRCAPRRARWARRCRPSQVTVLTLAAALPSASNVSLLAERYGADNGRIARIILARPRWPSSRSRCWRGPSACRRRAERGRQQRRPNCTPRYAADAGARRATVNAPPSHWRCLVNANRRHRIEEILLTRAGSCWLRSSAAPAWSAVDVGVGITIREPGVYGRIEIGSATAAAGALPAAGDHRPAPVMVQQPPMYLYVPPGHAKDWGKHCGRYNACARQVYFVQETLGARSATTSAMARAIAKTRAAATARARSTTIEAVTAPGPLRSRPPCGPMRPEIAPRSGRQIASGSTSTAHRSTARWVLSFWRSACSRRQPRAEQPLQRHARARLDQHLHALDAGHARHRRRHRRIDHHPGRLGQRSRGSGRGVQEVGGRLRAPGFGAQQRQARERRQPGAGALGQLGGGEGGEVVRASAAYSGWRGCQVCTHISLAEPLRCVAPGAAGGLHQQREQPLGRAEVAGEQRAVGVDRGHQRDAPEVVALGHHLRADQHVDLAGVHGAELRFERALEARAVGVDAGDARCRAAAPAPAVLRAARCRGRSAGCRGCRSRGRRAARAR